MKILEFPLARITIWFVTGILFSYYGNQSPGLIFYLLAVSFAVLLALHFFSKQRFRQQTHFGIALYLVCFLSGMATHLAHRESLRDSNYINNLSPNKDAVWAFTIRERLKSSAFGERFVAVINHLDGKPVSGKILVNVKTGTSHIHLQIGQQLLAIGKAITHKKPLNPGQFDYGKYLGNKSIYAQLYLDAENIKIRKEPKKDIWYYSDRFRDRIISNLEKKGFAAAELQVANALILGQQQEISPDILQDYQLAGAVHILSVSGLHVGFILLFLNFILKPLPKNKPGRLAKLIVILLSLWGFAIVAGLSPSVVRSATMFSFMALGMSLRRSTNIFHTLLVSLLLILLFEPAFLFDVGFQLSYVALFFILWLQPLLAGLWLPENKILKYFWDILTVSFAAQIGAFPLSIYYFHQFPGMFFLTNLVVIPFISIIMIAGVLVMLMAAFGYVPNIPLKILEWLIHMMDKIINVIASFEKFIIQDIPLHFSMLLGLYIFIFATVIWFRKPTFYKLVFVALAVMILQSSFIYTLWESQKTQEWIVFNTKKNTLVAARNGKWVTAFCNEKKSHPALKPYLIGNFCQIKRQLPISNVFVFGENKILCIDSSAVCPTNMQPDMILLRNSPKLNLERLLLSYNPKVIIADASNFKTYIARWKTTCTKEKIPFHFTGEKGFYRLKK